ncbi:hypothetical protein OH77DRAFT_1474701, partial [Trametes cingulata]
MEGSRLPIDLCEKLIDHCYSEPCRANLLLNKGEDPRSSWRTLFNCALTCRAWLTRSRFNLYTAVILRRPQDIDTFTNTIALHPFLAEFVRVLMVTNYNEPGNVYFPFARIELVRNMRCLQSLLMNTHYTRTYPPPHRRLIARYPITTLSISVDSFPTPIAFCRFLWAFTRLERLRLLL